ncbi:hypothetical protein [Maridesulfovibrio frigidus]|uniref:hypothetical protein n=1 Tax=Maridesulfovibrio frigidus TaxID=340956 RepID=UPI0004E2132C|nr:hypothetical protein [Maridesulfovibrio frigidus]
MKKFKVVILCLAAMLLMAGCSFKNAETAQNSMRDVNHSAEDLREESEASKKTSEELKEHEQSESVETHKW